MQALQTTDALEGGISADEQLRTGDLQGRAVIEPGLAVA